MSARTGGDAPQREFHCWGGQRWTIARHAPPLFPEPGLCFSRGDAVRFQGFSLGTLPSDHELAAMAEEVLTVLLSRAERQSPSHFPTEAA